MRLTQWDLPNETYPMRHTQWDFTQWDSPNETYPKRLYPMRHYPMRVTQWDFTQWDFTWWDFTQWDLPNETLPNETYPMRLTQWDLPIESYPMRLKSLMQIVTKHSSPCLSGHTGMYPFTIRLANETIQVQKFQRRIVKTYMCTMAWLSLKNKTHRPLEKWC